MKTVVPQLYLPVTERCSRVPVVKMVRLLEIADSGVIQGFHMQVEDVHRCYREAYDNVRFLATLERHFRVSVAANQTVMTP